MARFTGRFMRETGAELQRLGRLGSYELGSALSNGNGGNTYRGDLGLLTSQGGMQVKGPEQPQRESAWTPRVDRGDDKGRGMERG